MSTTTPNYGLTKQTGTENQLIGVINNNLDIIDNQMKANADAIVAGDTAADTADSASMWCNTLQSIPNTAFTAVDFDTILDDTRGNIADLANNRFYIRKAGVYIITFHGRFTTNNVGYRAALIYKNGAEIQVDQYAAAMAGVPTTFALHRQVSLVVGDLITVSVYQNSGAALTLATTNGGQVLSLTRVSA